MKYGIIGTGWIAESFIKGVRLKTDSVITAVYSRTEEKGGAFARFANRPRNCRDNPELGAEIQELYSDYYDRHHGARSGTKAWFTEEKAKEISRIPEKYGFTDIRYHLFYRERVLTAREYIQLLGTYSDHIAIGEEIRNEFFLKIGEAINRHGGTITINDTLDLELARK